MSGPGPVNAVRNLIDQHGWAVIGVFPTSVDDGPPFSYTVGMTDRGLPELAVYGLDLRSAGGVLNAVAAHVLTAGELPRGKAIDGLLAGGLPLVAITMTDTSDLSNVRALYGAVMAAQQIVWPDKSGLMPWQQWDLGDAQPLKGNPPHE
ncbi:MAG: DUF4262 domain-containing protein [Mycolicibacterium frederiksbergense]|uniref:DUF4262 domain-containing protein n=1 Tax=Mycobacterium adipatum TaxID=1682113 RepID=UPI0027FD52C6|nr:DUF4262 domain-containing protein [Mycolicibacterium frederiksbergense]